jgi:hypothetical protein
VSDPARSDTAVVKPDGNPIWCYFRLCAVQYAGT